MDANKNICCAKDESAAVHSTATWWLKKFYLDYKNLNYQVRPGGPKTMDFMP